VCEAAHSVRLLGYYRGGPLSVVSCPWPVGRVVQLTTDD